LPGTRCPRRNAVGQQSSGSPPRMSDEASTFDCSVAGYSFCKFQSTRQGCVTADVRFLSKKTARSSRGFHYNSCTGSCVSGKESQLLLDHRRAGRRLHVESVLRRPGSDRRERQSQWVTASLQSVDPVSGMFRRPCSGKAGFLLPLRRRGGSFQGSNRRCWPRISRRSKWTGPSSLPALPARERRFLPRYFLVIPMLRRTATAIFRTYTRRIGEIGSPVERASDWSSR